MDLTVQPDLALGKKSQYEAQYNPGILFPIPRAPKRLDLGLNPDKLPFWGYDCWNHYEVSWLNPKGKPEVALAEIKYDCHSTHIIESKSMKLYFNSINNSHFNSLAELESVLSQDLSSAVRDKVAVTLRRLGELEPMTVAPVFAGESIDHLDVECTVYTVNPDYLFTEETLVEEVLCSDLLKSNCLVTYQPDWGSISIHYQGPKINREGLLKYLVSFRNHNEFHEHCIERIFSDIMHQCKPQVLTVYGRFTRRGGVDINPYRSTRKKQEPMQNTRLVRQ